MKTDLFSARNFSASKWVALYGGWLEKWSFPPNPNSGDPTAQNANEQTHTQHRALEMGTVQVDVDTVQMGTGQVDSASMNRAPVGTGFFKRYRTWLLLVVGLLLAAFALWQYMPAIQEIISDRVRFQAFVDDLGWFGPVALIFFNALQIIIAPVPGYVVQLAAGFLYGPWWGGLWSTLGLFVGSMTAMWLARTYGRPLVERVIGAKRLQQWEAFIHGDNIYVWFILLLGPTGDAPYYLAGLSQVRFLHIALITLLIRVPTLFVAAAIGAGTMVLTWWQFVLILAAFGLVAAVLLRYQVLLSAWMDRVLKNLVQRASRSSAGAIDPDLSGAADKQR